METYAVVCYSLSIEMRVELQRNLSGDGIIHLLAYGFAAEVLAEEEHELR